MHDVEAKELEKKPRLFYGWYIVLASFLAHLSYAEQNSSVLGLFIRPMTREMGWSRTALTGAQSVARLVEGVCAPVLGPFIDRYGPRPLMLIGAVIVGFSFLWLSQIRTIWDFYMMKGFAVAVGFLFMGFMVTNTAISNWFVRLRGRAIGIAGMGTSLANIAMAPVAAWMMTRWGWRSVWAAFGVFTWVVVLLPSGLLMRRRPEDVGLKPDGDDSSPDQPSRSENLNPASLGDTEGKEAVWNRREAMGTRAFWLIVGTFSISSFA
ncbi:MAG: hypothetical protein HW403_744, partial [Dehalococcoidia bacterium]|nr:hypothetical protein [Dehalococcoidia bacterium]